MKIFRRTCRKDPWELFLDNKEQMGLSYDTLCKIFNDLIEDRCDFMVERNLAD